MKIVLEYRANREIEIAGKRQVGLYEITPESHTPDASPVTASKLWHPFVIAATTPFLRFVVCRGGTSAMPTETTSLASGTAAGVDVDRSPAMDALGW